MSVIAQRFSGVSTSTPLEASQTNAGPPTTDDQNMLQAVTTLTSGAWAVAVGWYRGATLTLPGGETAILINLLAGSGGDATHASMWFEGPVGSPGSTQLGGTGDLSTANDWAMIVVSLRPGP